MSPRQIVLATVVLVAGLVHPATSAGDDEILFRVSVHTWPLVAGEPVELKAWIANISDHPVRIPTDLQHFVYPEAFRPPNYRPKYLLIHSIPEVEIETVSLPPGGFYGCIVRHSNGFDMGYWEIWLRLEVRESDANPGLWLGQVESNKVQLVVEEPK